MINLQINRPKYSLLFSVSFLLLSVISLQSVNLPIGAQVIPLTSVFAALIFPVWLLMRPINSTPISRAVLWFVVFLLVHSLLTLLIDMWSGEDLVRVITWLRQIVSLFVGYAVYWVLRDALTVLSPVSYAKILLTAAFPALLMGLLNIVWGIFHINALGWLILTIRSRIIITGAYTDPYRATGLSLEPSHYAFYLSVAVIPLAIYLFIQSKFRRRFFYLGVIFVSLLCLGWTFSSTGFAVVAIMVFSTWFLRGQFKWVVLIPLVVGFLTIVSIPDNYVLMQFASLRANLSDGGEANASVADIFGSNLGPIQNALSSLVLLGYGLGGTATHWEEIVPAAYRDQIAAVRFEDIPSLGTLLGRVLAEGGAFGLLLYAYIWVIGFTTINKLYKQLDKPNRTMLNIAQVCLVGVLAGYTIKQGSFALPYWWLWLAYVDSRFILLKRNQKIT